MYKQTLCVTLPISAAVIIAAALFAKAGDLNPPEGSIGPTMHDLQEIYDLVQQSSPCGGCTWEYKALSVVANHQLEVVPGTGVLHGIWLKGDASDLSGKVRLCNGPCNDNIIIGEFIVQVNSAYSFHNQFFQLDVEFDQGLHLKTFPNLDAEVTFLYRSTN